MHFRTEETNAFIKLFESVKSKIAAQEGCEGVKLIQDVSCSDVFFTLSHWKTPEHLEMYRNSELFATTWSTTKAMFKEKAKAWSTSELSAAGF